MIRKVETMKKTVTLSSLIGVILVLLVVAPASAATMRDEFNDNTIDPAKWVTNGSVVEADGYARLQIGGLRSLAQFDPAVNPVTIKARARLHAVENNVDKPQHISFYTRGSADGNSEGAKHGVRFLFGSNFVEPSFRRRIQGQGAANGTTVDTRNGLGLGKLEWNDVEEDEWFEATFTDDGTNLTLTGVDSQGNTPGTPDPVATTSTFDGEDYVWIGHRDHAPNGWVDIDWIEISQVPEPATLVLLGPGAMVLLLRRRRR